jgi:hypothetical protein
LVTAAGWTRVSVAPREDAKVTVLPATGLLFPSRRVIVIVEVATPSATTVVGLATTVDVVAETPPMTKVTAAVWVTVMVSVVSVAVSVLVPAVVDRTVPVVCPLALVTAAGWTIVSVAPRDDAKVTVLPLTGLLLVSRKVIVIVDVVVPSATTVVGAAATVEVVGETAPAVNVTAAVCVTVIASVVSVAVSVLVPAVVDRTVPVVCPLALVTAAGWTIVSVAPREEAKVTVLPLTRLLLASRKVIVIVAVVVPSATTDVGLATTVDVVAETPPVANVTAAVWVTVMVSVVSVAVSVLVPAVVDRTVPVVCPLAFVTAAGWTRVSVAPRDDAKVTVLPLTGLLLVSRSVTVIVEVATPSAVTVVGLAVTVDAVADTAPAVNVTAAVCVTVIASVVSVAVSVPVPAVVDRTVPVVCPLTLVTAAGWTRVSIAPRDEASVTVLPATGLLLPSRRVIVIVDVATPFATTVVGLATTLDVVADTPPVANVTTAVCVTVIVSVVSVAVTVLVPAVAERMVPVVCPLAFVTAAGWTMVSVAPRDDAKLTVLPLTGLLLVSRSVTVIVEVATPSAVTVVGLATTVEVVADTAPAVNVTDAVGVTTMASVVSVAVSVLVPAMVERTVPVVWPAALVGATGWTRVSVAPREEASVTALPLTGLLFASRKVMVIVEVVVPSAVTVVGLATTVDVVADTAPAPHVTLEVGGCVASLVFPVVPATASVTVSVIGPSAR